MTPATLVVGASAREREAAIAARLLPGQSCAVIAEGLADARSALADAAERIPTLHIARIAAGCPCCTGHLVMRVTLDRLLRERPQQLYIALATGSHVDALRQWLARPPYDAWLSLTADLIVPA
jgi:hypothetical protein